MNLVHLDDSHLSLAELVGQLVHDLRSVQTAQAGFINCVEPLLAADPEMAVHITKSVANLHTVGDDLQIVRLLLAGNSKIFHTTRLEQIISRLQHVYEHTHLVMYPQLLPDVSMSSNIYDVLALLVRIIDTLPLETNASPIIIRVRACTSTKHIVVQVGCTISNAATAAETGQWIQSIITTPATKHTTLTMRLQLFSHLMQAYAWPFRYRVIQSKLIFSVVLPITARDAS